MDEFDDFTEVRKAMLRGLWDYFYYNQYDEKYPTFRASDKICEYDMDGTKEEIVVFYE